MAVSEDGFGGLIGITLLGVLALAGIVDVVVNDILPSRYSLKVAHRYRHVVFMLIAIGQVALVLALARAMDLKPSVGRYILDASMAAWLACIGVYDHFVNERHQRLERVSQRAGL